MGHGDRWFYTPQDHHQGPPNSLTPGDILRRLPPPSTTSSSGYVFPSSRVIGIQRLPFPQRINPRFHEYHPHQHMPTSGPKIEPVTSSSSSEASYSPASCYSTVQDDKFHPEYEDLNNVYEKPPDVPNKKSEDTLRLQCLPPPPPPVLNHATLQKLMDSRHASLLLTDSCNFKQQRTALGCKVSVLVAVLAAIGLLLGCSLFAFYLHTQKTMSMKHVTDSGDIAIETGDIQSLAHPAPSQAAANTMAPAEAMISAKTLLTFMLTKKKMCLFEVSSLQLEESRNDFATEHIDGARLLAFSNLSHSGVPVHPLQFQRYVRNMGVDTDCHIVVYDKGEQIWSSYAVWVFKLFGHEKVSLLNGGFPEWKRLSSTRTGPYETATGPAQPPRRPGDFRAGWTGSYIAAFDDVMANFESKKYDLVDAQTPEEYDGTAQGAIFGHIMTAVNIPPEDIFDTSNNTYHNNLRTGEIFSAHGIHPTRPVIVYCGTSLHASMVWFALHRLNFNTAIYFGSWPEWVIRAPDYLKVIPGDGLERISPSSSENLRPPPPRLRTA